jgi:hypothetical protein
MKAVPQAELNRLRETLEAEARQLEEQAELIQERLRQRREQIRAIDVLLAPEEANGPSSKPASTAPIPAQSVASSRVGFTPTDAYWMPILEALEERSGREHSDVVLDLVEKKMAGILKSEDYELLPSGLSVRWRNRAQWQRQNMVQQGLLRKDSPRGVWEITPTGRQWLQQRKRKSS